MPDLDVIARSNGNAPVLDKENAEYLKDMLRPAVIKEDVKLMEQRQRVSKILHSDAFHKELNKILDQQMREGSVCGGKAGSATDQTAITALQEISNLLLPQARLGCSVFNRGAKMPIIPINDIRAPDKNMNKTEKLLRCKLASVYRLMDLHGWGTGMVLHGSVRLAKDSDRFLVSCHGYMNHEIQASTLLKVDVEGEPDDPESGRVDGATWRLHNAVHSIDASYRCVLHVRTPSVVAVSCMRSGLLPICEEALSLGPVVMANGAGGIGEVVGSSADTRCVLVRNQGVLARGRTVEEAWAALCLAVHCCEVQVRLAASLGTAASESVIENLKVNLLKPSAQPETHEDDNDVMQFEALMRALDATGHRTGHFYRFAPVSMESHHHHHHSHQNSRDDGNLADREDGDDEDDEDVEVPPSATSFSTRSEDNNEHQAAMRGPPEPRWLLHMPNDYVRHESQEPGPRNQRRVVTWESVPPEQRQTSGLVEPCTSANQFAPLGLDPNELRQQQMKVKSKYFQDVTTAGHQSRVLRSLDEVEPTQQHQQRPASGKVPADSGSTAPDTGVVLVGAVSQGIIDKKHRNDPSVYQSCFSPNPFDRVTEDELRQYEKKVMGGDQEEEATTGQMTSPAISVIESPDVVESDLVKSKKAPVQESAPTVTEVHVESAEITEGAPGATAATGSTLSPERIENIRSDTSGADLSHDDTEREGQKSTGGKKKRKKLKEMFSFRKKDKKDK